MGRARPLDPDARRAQLLAVAREVFADRGYHATNVSDIIEGAKVARGTFYNYFESKRGVFQAVLESLMLDVIDAVEPIDVARPIEAQVRGNLRSLIEALVEMGPAARILFTDAAAIDDDGAQSLRAFYLGLEDRLTLALGAGQVIGVVRAGDARTMAVLLIGMIREPIALGWLHERAIDVDVLVAELERTLLGGMITR